MLKLIKLLIKSRLHGVPRSELWFAEQIATHEFFKSCDAIIDVGANQGMFSTAMALVSHNIPIHAFEPLPMVQSKLKKQVSKFPSVHVHTCALGSAPGTAFLHFGSFHEASSLLPMERRHEEYFPGSTPTDDALVTVKTIDQFFSEHSTLKQAFMKLDVQGYELEVLKGASNSLNCICAALVEISFEELYKGGATECDIINTFYKNGFKIAGFYRQLYKPNSSKQVSCDCLFTRIK